MTDLRRRRPQAHLGVLLGLSTSAYAIALNLVTAEQSTADSAALAARVPIEVSLAEIGQSHDRLDASLSHARRDYETAAAEYGDVGSRITALEDELAAFGDVVTDIAGFAAALPDRAPMPTVRSHVAVVSAPPAHATTGASGG